MTEDMYEKAMRDFLQGVSGPEHPEAAKALGMAMLADVIKNTFGGYRPDIKGAAARVRADRQLRALRSLVEKQANDTALWFKAVTAPEECLQKALRELHAAIEGKTQLECVKDLLTDQGLMDIEKGK